VASSAAVSPPEPILIRRERDYRYLEDDYLYLEVDRHGRYDRRDRHERDYPYLEVDRHDRHERDYPYLEDDRHDISCGRHHSRSSYITYDDYVSYGRPRRSRRRERIRSMMEDVRVLELDGYLVSRTWERSEERPEFRVGDRSRSRIRSPQRDRTRSRERYRLDEDDEVPQLPRAITTVRPGIPEATHEEIEVENLGTVSSEQFYRERPEVVGGTRDPDPNTDSNEGAKPQGDGDESAGMVVKPDSAEMASALFSKSRENTRDVETMTQKMQASMMSTESGDAEEKQGQEDQQ
jgi:hypothetical protein